METVETQTPVDIEADLTAPLSLSQRPLPQGLQLALSRIVLLSPHPNRIKSLDAICCSESERMLDCAQGLPTSPTSPGTYVLSEIDLPEREEGSPGGGKIDEQSV